MDQDGIERIEKYVDITQDPEAFDFLKKVLRIPENEFVAVTDLGPDPIYNDEGVRVFRMKDSIHPEIEHIAFRDEERAQKRYIWLDREYYDAFIRERDPAWMAG